MKAVVLNEYGGPEKLKFEDNVPDPQISGDTVLIASAAASVNPIDWKMRSGARQKDFPLSFPAILGRDVSGVVRAVGASVKHFKPGDRLSHVGLDRGQQSQCCCSVIDLNKCRRTHLRKTKHRSQLSIRLTNGMISLEIYSIQGARPGLQRTSKV
jgi:NADPH:quinone reductase-like Zn-dependent oxidoreductase